MSTLALSQTDLIGEMIAGIGAKQARVRLGASKALQNLSCQSPQLLYPHFDFFAALLGHANQVLKWNALTTLANLAPVDSEGKLDSILSSYLSPIAGPNMITAAHAIRGGAIIGSAKPHLAQRIAREILCVEGAVYATAECRNIAIGHALQAFGVLCRVLPNNRAIRAFARRQRGNPRAATAAKARKFLDDIKVL